MIIDDFEVRVLFTEPITDNPVSRKTTLDLNDIMYYSEAVYQEANITSLRLMSGEDILVDLTYEKFKEKYNKRKAEILASMGNRPKEQNP